MVEKLLGCSGNAWAMVEKLLGCSGNGSLSQDWNPGSIMGNDVRGREMDYGQLQTEIALMAKGMSGREIAKLGMASLLP